MDSLGGRIRLRLIPAILTAVGVLGTGALTAYFQEDYRQAGSIMSLVYAVGMLVMSFSSKNEWKIGCVLSSCIHLPSGKTRLICNSN